MNILDKPVKEFILEKIIEQNDKKYLIETDLSTFETKIINISDIPCDGEPHDVEEKCICISENSLEATNTHNTIINNILTHKLNIDTLIRSKN